AKAPANVIEGDRAPGEPRGRNVERHAGHRRGWRRAERVEVVAADHLTRAVDVGPCAVAVARGRQLRHHAVPPQESVDRTVRRDGDPHDLAGVVDAVRDRGTTAQIPEVPDNAGLPEDRVRDAVGAGAAADDLARGVDVPRGAELVARQTSEVGHRAGLPEERVHEAVRRETAAHDLTGVVDAVRRAGMTAEGPEVCHLAALPEDGVARRRRRGRESAADGLSLLVDREGDAGTKIRHDSVLPDERMHFMGGDLALAGDETGIAHSMRNATAAAERP